MSCASPRRLQAGACGSLRPGCWQLPLGVQQVSMHAWKQKDSNEKNQALLCKRHASRRA